MPAICASSLRIVPARASSAGAYFLHVAFPTRSHIPKILLEVLGPFGVAAVGGAQFVIAVEAVRWLLG
jgi:hypothetical protein